MNVLPLLFSVITGEPVEQTVPPPPVPIVAPAPKPKPKQQEPFLNCSFTKDNVYKCVP